MAGDFLEEGLRRELNGLAKGWLNQLIAILDELAAGLLTALDQRADAARAGLDASLRAQGYPSQHFGRGSKPGITPESKRAGGMGNTQGGLFNLPRIFCAWLIISATARNFADRIKYRDRLTLPTAL